jgi:glycosyltransferase involved in cell wall biosynthesis
MRILHLIPTFGGGGAERQLAYLAQGLGELGCETHAASTKGGVNLSRFEAAGGIAHRIAASGNYDPLLVPRVARLIQAIRPDIVQTWLTQMDVIGGAAVSMTPIPWILSERAAGAAYRRLDVRNALRRVMGDFADAIIANSGGGAAMWAGSPARKFIIPNAVALEEIAAAPRDCTDFGHSEVILFVGRLDPLKNTTNLIEALAEVVIRRDAVALLCGEGPSRDEVCARIRARGCSDRIVLLGYTDRVWSLMKRADVVVSTSWVEGRQNAVTEAASCGCPLVLSDIPAHREFLDDQAAYYAPPGEPHAVAAAIERVLNDTAEACAHARRAREIVSEWSIRNIAAQYLRAYEQVLKRRAA